MFSGMWWSSYQNFESKDTIEIVLWKLKVWRPNMDARSLAVLLKQTLEPTTRAEAEAELDKVSKIIGFAPGILQVK